MVMIRFRVRVRVRTIRVRVRVRVRTLAGSEVAYFQNVFPILLLLPALLHL